MSDGDLRLIEWHASDAGGGSLGRHVNHDPRSRGFLAERAPVRKSVMHRTYGPVLDQGQLGACTGFSSTTACNTAPTRKAGVTHTDAEALAIYERATQLDSFKGEYPPIDTGSDGLSAAKACAEKGWISSYAWAFGLDHALDALVLAAITVGTEWPDCFDRPDSAGRVRLQTGWQSRGGHQWCLTGLHVPDKTWRARQTWGPGFGDHGNFYGDWSDLGTLLEAQGDACVLNR